LNESLHGTDMDIRRAAKQDIGRIMEIYRAAQDFMIRSGNPGQWGRTYPPEELVRDDIRRGFCHVICEDGKIHAVAALCKGDDPYYSRIDGGEWLNDDEYIAIHRIASDGFLHGVFTFVADCCKKTYDNIRVDTHRDNLPMQKQIIKNGFVKCGTVYVRDGTARIAFQWCRSRDTDETGGNNEYSQSK